MMLLVALLAPGVAALLCALIPAPRVKLLGLLGAGVGLAAALAVFQAAAAQTPPAFSRAWVPSLGLTFTLGADGVSALVLVLGGLITLLAVLATRTGDLTSPRLFVAMLLLTQTGVAGVLLARDMVLFYVFWEAVLIPLFVLLVAFGGEAGRPAAIRLLIYTGLGSLAMLLAILALYGGSGGHSFAITDLARATFPDHPVVLGLTTADLAFLGFALAFAVKSPLFPFHGWLADAYTAAPTPVAMLLAGVVSKLGLYGFYRLGLELMPAEAHRFSGPLMALAAVGLVYGALLALRERDAKRTVAWVSLSHVNFIALGLLGLTAAGLSGGALQMANHGVLIAALFFAVGEIERRLGSRDRGAFAGLARRAPALSALLLVVALGTLGLPGLNGFVGEYLIMAGTFARSGWLLALAATGVVLAAWYTLRLYQGLMSGEPRPAGGDVDIGGLEAGVLVPLAALTVVVGVYPAPLLDAVNHTITLLAGGGG